MELIKIAGGDYERYEELLFQREQLRKDAELYRKNYINRFGDLITSVYELKIKCISLKKSIAFCQASLNQNKKPNQEELNQYLEIHMAAYYENLEKMMQDKENCSHMSRMTEADRNKIKTIYRKIARMIHPDISPLLEQYPQISELWNYTSIAYENNDLEMMEEAEILVTSALNQLGVDSIQISIPNIQERIVRLEEQIHQILHTEPYIYKEVLENEEKSEEKIQALQQEKKQYIEYVKKLEETLRGMLHE